MTGAYNCFIYLHYITTAVYFYKSTNLHMWGLCGPFAPPAQSSSTSYSHVCTLTAISLGNPGSCGVKHPREWPPAVASESDCGSSKVRRSSSSMIDPHSHNCHRLCSSASCSVSPCSSSAAGWQFRARFSLFLYFLVFLFLLQFILLLFILLLFILLLLLQGGVIGPARKAADPEPCNAGCLLGNAWHIIRQCHD